MAAVDITFGDFCWPIIQITRGICCRIALLGVRTASTVALDMNSSTFSFYISFSTTVVTGRTVHRWMYPVTVFPTIGRKARPALVFTMKYDLSILKCIMSGTILSNKIKKSNKEMSTSLNKIFRSLNWSFNHQRSWQARDCRWKR